MEMRRHADRLLPSRRVGHQKDLLRFEEFSKTLDFLNQRNVDLLSTGGIENLDVPVLLGGPLKTGRSGPNHIFLLRIRSVNRHLHLLSKGRELLDRGRSL